MYINQILEKLGFSPNETKVYLAGLESGISSAQLIAQKSGVKRTTAYSVLSYLVNRGVVAKTKIKGKTRFVAEPPQRLLTLINELEHGIKEALPQLEAIYNKQETKPKITFYEGAAAIQKVYDDTLIEKPEEILEWNTNKYFERFPKDHDYIKKRITAGIKAKRIGGKGSVWDTKHKYLDTKELSETEIVPKELFWPEIEVNIYNNKVAFMNYADNMSVIIESKAIADAMRQAYNLSWIGAKSIETK
jgi:sugar-specific transcriptional regulator TrmB